MGLGYAMAAKDIAVKKYVVKLDEAERNFLQAVFNKGKSPAKRLLKARILLKADAGAHGEGWSDGRIVEALDTNISMVTRVRQQFVEEGLEAVLSRKLREARPGCCHFKRRCWTRQLSQINISAIPALFGAGPIGDIRSNGGGQFPGV
jgi:hypothetical protein